MACCMNSHQHSVSTVESSEPVSLGRDMLFAAASVALICGVNLPGKIPLFTAFAVVVFVVSVRRILKSRVIKNLFVPPLIIFLFIHLTFAFRVSASNGLAFVLQAIIVGSFVIAFTNRYSQIGMSRYLQLTGIGMMGLLIFVVVYHITNHVYTSYKLLADPKAVFDLLPLMLLVLRLSDDRSAKILLPLLLPVVVVITLLSGERKAYILLVLFSPFLLNFRSLTTYVLPLILVAVVSAGLSLDRTGYVERQINTFSHLAEGESSKTISDEARSWAIRHAAQTFVDNPIIGVGTNGLSATVDSRIHASTAAHNEWLRVAADNGMVGLFFFVATLIWAIVGLLRTRVGDRSRTRNEKLVAFALFSTLLIYFSFEAYDFIVLTSFVLTPLVQFLRLDPNDAPAAVGVVRLPPARAPVSAYALSNLSTVGDYSHGRPARDQ